MSRSCPLTSSFRTCLKEAIADEETEPADMLEDLALIEEEAMPVDSYLSMSMMIAAASDCCECGCMSCGSKASKKSKKGKKSRKRALQTEDEIPRYLNEPRGRERRLPVVDCGVCCPGT